MTPTWERVNGLERGGVYQQGNVNDFIKMTGWGGGHVLYIGDHVFSDLAVSFKTSIVFLVFMNTHTGADPPTWLEDRSHHSRAGQRD